MKRLTFAILKELCPTSNDKIVKRVVKFLNEYAEKYEINTPLRMCHFLAQAAHESAHFRTLEEFASGEAYEGRADLGNTKPGDGVKYKGRGIFQLTGRSNYRRFGGRVLENNPELAANPRISVLSALEYWKDRKLNFYADKDDIETITRRINGGLNGFAGRQKYLAKIKTILL